MLGDLAERFDSVLTAIEATDGWVTNRVTPGKIILGELGDIESGMRQLIRREPLEVVGGTLAADAEHAEVAAEVSRLVRHSGMSQQDFAEQIGTSGSRLSTYISGKVMPSAALMVRMRRVASHRRGEARAQPQGSPPREGRAAGHDRSGTRGLVS
ncbi:MAG: helix-turn-helix transcriptional regulator [Streptosporangiaceae bacterium]